MRGHGEVPASWKAPGKSISEGFPRNRVAWLLSNPGAGGFRGGWRLYWNLPCWVVKRDFLGEAEGAVGAWYPFCMEEQPTVDQKPLGE